MARPGLAYLGPAWPGSRPQAGPCTALYIVLSRSAGRHLIRLLRDFDDQILKCEHDQKLITEDDRLAGLNLETRNWYAW